MLETFGLHARASDAARGRMNTEQNACSLIAASAKLEKKMQPGYPQE
jgi:hypothetical protein